MGAETTNYRAYVHSGDFFHESRINDMTQEEWEKQHGIDGYIEALKSLGWLNNYQWRWRHPDKVVSESGRGCFAEVFPSVYLGYLRGDGDTLTDAFRSCLDQAQRFAKCERTVGHEWTIAKKRCFFNCKHCGFYGYSPEYRELKSKINNLEIHRELLQEQVARARAALALHGVKLLLFEDDPEATEEERSR